MSIRAEVLGGKRESKLWDNWGPKIRVNASFQMADKERVRTWGGKKPHEQKRGDQ